MEKSSDYNNKNNSILSNSIKDSPNYQRQIDEINLLKNILKNKLTILEEDSNFIIQLEIKGSSNEEVKKKFKLIIYLNYFYPNKVPKFNFYEINNNLF